jgi:hypothetical protein
MREWENETGGDLLRFVEIIQLFQSFRRLEKLGSFYS